MLRWLVLLAAVQQAAVPFFINPFRDGPSRVQAGVPSQIEPAGYAFAIWSLIYLGAVAYAVWQLTRAGRADPATARIAPCAIGLFLGSSLWLWCAQSGPLWATMPILGAMAVLAVTCLAIATAGSGDRLRRWVVAAPFALYAGWTACATFVNVAEVAPQFGFGRFGLSVPAYGALSIAGATLAAVGALALSRGEPLLGTTVVWALVGILVAGVQRGYGAPVMAAAAAGIGVVLAATWWLRREARQ